MALPAGVTTATVTVGVPVSHTGAAVKTFVSIEPSAFLVHAESGTPLVDFLEELQIAEGVSGQFTLPHTDQAGFTDEAGNSYTNWYYTARVSYSTPSKAKTKAPKIKVFQLATGQTTVDLDKLPGGAPAQPYTAATAKVDAFHGRTGAVTLQETDLPERLSDTSLNATYATAAAVAAKADLSAVGTSKASRVFRLACLGNSLYDGTATADTNVYDTNPETIYTDSTWYNIAIVMSNGKIARGGNYGIGGQNTAQVVARVPDVIAANPRPNACVMGELTNTIGGGADDTATLAAVDLLFTGADQLAAAGIIPIIMNTPTRGNTAVPKTDDERRRVALANAKIARLAAQRGYPLIDVHRVTIDPATGKLLEAATTDGVHYTKLYNRKVAEAALDVLLPMAGGYSPFLADWNADPTNLLTNGLFLGSTTTVNSYPMPAGWNGGSNNQRAITAPVAADKVLGNWFDLWKDATVGAATGTDYTSSSPSIAAGASTFAVGDKMRFACRVRVEDIENGVVSTGSLHMASITVLLGGISQNIGPLYQYQVNITDGLAVAEFTVPTGATTMAVYLGLAGQGKLRVAQMTLRNLTKLGIA